MAQAFPEAFRERPPLVIDAGGHLMVAHAARRDPSHRNDPLRPFRLPHPSGRLHSVPSTFEFYGQIKR